MSSYVCVDSGSEYCPCVLAEVGECINCTRINGSDVCDCAWGGICAMEHARYHPDRMDRVDSPASTLSWINMEDRYLYLDVRVDYPIWAGSHLPGSFLFVRPESHDSKFNIPLCVFRTLTGSRLAFFVKVEGPKTKTLKDRLILDPNLIVHGPHHNGILGITHIRKTRFQRILLVVYGVGQASVPLLASYLTARGNSVDAAIDTADLGRDLIGEDLVQRGGHVWYLALRTEKGKAQLERLLKEGNYSMVYSAGPDGQHYRLELMLKQLALDTVLCVSNNALMSCGEGVCGACFTMTRDGKGSFRACKANPDPETVFMKTSLLCP